MLNGRPDEGAGRCGASAKPTKKAGFTLIEMLVVMAISGLIAGLAFPAIERMMRRQEFESAARTLDLTLQQARAAAILHGAPVRFVPLAVPPAMRLELPAHGIMFFADGTSTGGSATLSGNGRLRRVDVDAETGLIRGSS